MALEVPYRSIPDMFRQRVAATPDREALGYPTPDEGIAWLTWAGADRRVAAIPTRLIGLRGPPQGRVALLCSIPVQWILAAFGVLCARSHPPSLFPPPL